MIDDPSIPPDICKGCRNYNIAANHPTVWCAIHRFGYVDKCPCHNCLIKAMCSKICDEIKTIIDLSNEEDL